MDMEKDRKKVDRRERKTTKDTEGKRTETEKTEMGYLAPTISSFWPGSKVSCEKSTVPSALNLKIHGSISVKMITEHRDYESTEGQAAASTSMMNRFG